MNRELPANSNLSHYRIVSKIGEGGMGEVYLAEDSRLDRKVALKVLPPDLASNHDRMERFVREAKSAAALNHPHIAQVFEIGEHDGTHFIAMEFIDGVTLREKIHRERTELKRLLRILQQVAEGLAKAHAAGIVHRDLKPDNIMITRDGFAKVLDFGLAKLVEKSWPGLGQSERSTAPTNVMQQHSAPGMVMGTVGYMSPEQAEGKTNEIDQRSDIFSFGCILFEAVTGKKPFEADSVIKSLHSLVYEPAPQLKDLNPSAPAELQRIVGRCLEKDPDERYQTIKDVGIELKHLRRGMTDAIETRAGSSPSTSQQASVRGDDSSQDTSSNSSVQTEPVAAPSTQISSIEYIVAGINRHKLATFLLITVAAAAIGGFAAYRRTTNSEARIESIAVMPFVNESGNVDVEYLSDGMTETLISSLSQLPNLNVKARSSVFRYKGKEIDLQKIAQELKVQAILTGRVVQRGDQLTLSLELVDTRTENAIWSEQYNRKQTDLVTLQSEIARDVSSKLRVRLSGTDEQRLAKSYTANPEAYQLYLKGRFYWNKRASESLKQAVEFYKQAIEKDPSYALAYSGLAETYVLFSPYSVALPQESFPQAKAAALRALEIDDSLAEAHAALGLYLTTFERNRSEAEKELRRAIELNPAYATAHHWLGLEILAPSKRFDEALVELRRAEELDPLSSVIVTEVGGCLLYARRYDEAIAQFKHSLTLDPKFYYAHVYLGWAFNAKGMYREAIDEYRKALDLNDDPTAKAFLALSLAKSGGRHEAIKLRDQLKMESTHRYVPSYCFAIIHLALGEKDEAFEWLEKDIDERSSWPVVYAVVPELDELRDDPRFKHMLQRLNLPE
jgi:eukaryotic-like serine/threonine-protein kinase